MRKTVYVSITGLRLKRPWHWLRFAWHAVPTFREAQRAPGNLGAEARTIGGVRHTLTVWESEAAMRRFLHGGAHRRAMRAYPAIATGLTFGYETDCVPGWDKVLQLWRERGRRYG